MTDKTFPRHSHDSLLPDLLSQVRPLPRSGRALVMGIVNVTPDSFSDGGRWLDPRRAVEHGLALVEEGAHILDLGAESTRPGGGVYGEGAREVSAAEELDRLLPVVEGLRQETSVPLSIDTRKAAVAERALAAGGALINDVSALGDPGMAAVAAARRCPLILMHSRGELSSMQRGIHYDDVMGEIVAELLEAVARAEEAGVERAKIILDPGIGFGKTYEGNVEILARLPELRAAGFPVLVGASRKSFIGHLTGGAPPTDRLSGSLASVAAAVAGGAFCVRVHDVRETVRFLAVLEEVAETRKRFGEPSESSEPPDGEGRR